MSKLVSPIIALLFASFLRVACSSPTSAMSVKASISPEPIVGQVVVLHIELSTKTYAPNTTLTVTLYDGIELVNGDLTWLGDLSVDQPVTIDTTIRVIKEGEWPINIYAFSSNKPESEVGFGTHKILYLNSSLSSANVIEDIARTSTPVPAIQHAPESVITPLTPVSD
jgi:hypothetical protein